MSAYTPVFGFGIEIFTCFIGPMFPNKGLFGFVASKMPVVSTSLIVAVPAWVLSISYCRPRSVVNPVTAWVLYGVVPRWESAGTVTSSRRVQVGLVSKAFDR